MQNNPSNVDAVGYPLVDFLNQSGPSALRRVVRSFLPRAPRPRKVETDTKRAELVSLLDGISLCHLDARVIKPPQGHVRYQYHVGLHSTKRVGLSLRNPFDTLITFGRHESATYESPISAVQAGAATELPRLGDFLQIARDAFELLQSNSISETQRAHLSYFYSRYPKFAQNIGAILQNIEAAREISDEPIEKQRPCHLNLRFTVNRLGVLHSLRIWGETIKINFSTGLIRPVVRNEDGGFAPTGSRQGVELKQAVITVTRGQAPHISHPLSMGQVLVQIGRRPIYATIGSVRLGGSFVEPKIIFDDVRVVK